MKIKKITITMVIAISLTLGLITGCTNKVSDTNEKIYTIEQISSIKEDLSKKISESIEIVVLG
ncbi:hypothetical protein NMF83_17705 [Clostridioides difficile]|uniref:hypothetical protein n=1 Tax=Clostridioides difficile TaxID=1496 RepID=UPI00202E7858|nr:hypothetical protein [Clostridioides difficile]MCB4303729.1 hypothetical protein [Clostridioides difficile]MCM0739017.1 hypothetical protein [Clostridioides difficile]MCM0746860.1 hypothetical protein [Clostridioides difficile]MCP8368136.1 hypothetical protein [Clostridioides difficile]MCP8386899.1 hypothetical protein [Clostridioides difficile]